MTPLLDRPLILASALVYAALTLAVGWWAMRRTRTARDFFIAGQDVGLLVTGLATTSATFSGFVFIGGPGLTYRLGLASLLISASVGFTAGLLGWTVAKRLRLLAEVRPVLTVPDAILCRYRSRLASGLAALAVVAGTIGYLGAQLLALGVMIEAIFGTRALAGEASLPLAMAAGLVVILAYSVTGGMVAGVYTDVLQGSLMLVAALAVFAHALASGGGLGAIARRIAASDVFGPSFLDPLGGVPVMTAVGFFFVFAVGSLGQPHVLHKFYMLDEPRKLKWLPLTLGLSQALCVLIWLGIGLAVPSLVAAGRLAPLANPDDAAPAFLLGFVPEVLAGLVFAGILAAIMSSADSFLNVAAAALVRDLPRALGRRPRRQLQRGRWAVLGVAIAAAFFALVYGDLVALLGTFAFGTFAAALTPALAVGLNWRRVSAAAASASIATGVAVNLGLEFLARQTLFPALPRPAFLVPGVLPAAVALAASFTVLIALSWLRGGRRPLDEDVAAVMEA
ncbi:MAG: sodium/proline symporter [Acidobacteria bacterium]|nr:MAG: sodium/proline symporter [Acidobacteriota bacterium]